MSDYTSPRDLLNPNASDQPSNDFLFDTPLSRVERLEQAKQKKLEYLSETNNLVSLDDSFTDFGDGMVESNRNKVWNQMTPQEIQSVEHYGISNYTLTRDEDGTLRTPDGNTYDGPTKRLYAFGAKDGGYKYGIASGHYDGSERRYQSTSRYNVDVGPQGVNLEDKQLDVLLPERVAKLLEGMAHGRRDAFNARSVPDLYTDPSARDPYGSGSSEYYTSREGLFGASAELDVELGERLFNQYIGELEQQLPRPLTEEERLTELKRLRQEVEADNADLTDRIANTGSAFASSFVNELLVQPLEAVGDLTGLYDMEGASETVQEAFGYNPVHEQRAMQEIGKQWEVITSDNASTIDKVKAAASGMATAFTTPEMLGQSGGVIAAWAVPGGVIGKLGKGTKYASRIAAIDRMHKSGKLSYAAAKSLKLQALATVPGIKAALTKQSGHIVAALGNVNEQYEEFVANNGGVELEGADKAKWFASRYGVQMVNQNLDALVAIDVIKSPGFFKQILPSIKAMTNKEFAAVAKSMAKGVLVSGKDMAEEAVQEYSQTMMELFNSRYGSEVFKDQDTFKEFLSDKRNLTEAGIAAIAGAGGALQFDAAGTVVPTTGAVIGELGKGVGAVRAKLPSVPPSTPAAPAAIDTTVGTNSETATAAANTNVAASYFSAWGTDSPQLRTEASTRAAQTAQAVLGGTHTVFQSDPDPETGKEKTLQDKLKEYGPLVAMIKADNPNMTIDQLISAFNKYLKVPAEEEAAVKEQIAEAYKMGQRFASLKALSEVAEEVSDGARGYRTYFAEAMSALAEGDNGKYDKAVGKLDYFVDHQKTKLGAVQSGIREMTQRTVARLEELVRQNKASTVEEAAKIMLKQEQTKNAKLAEDGKPLRGRKIDHGKGTASTLITHEDILREIAFSDAKNGRMHRGIFKWVQQVQNEVKVMDQVYESMISSMNPDTAQETTVEQEIATEARTPEQITISNDDLDLDGMDTSLEDVPPTTATPVKETTEDLVDGISAEDFDLASIEDTVLEPEIDEEISNEDLSLDDLAGEYDESIAENYDEPVAYDDTANEYEEAAPGEYDTTVGRSTPTLERNDQSKTYEDNEAAIRKTRKAIDKRKGAISSKDWDADPRLLRYQKQLKELLTNKKAFVNVLQAAITERVAAFKDKVEVLLYTAYRADAAPKLHTKELGELFSILVPTGFTLDPVSEEDVLESTMEFAKKLRATMSAKTNFLNPSLYKQNPFFALLTDAEGNINYNVAEAAHAAALEFVMQEATNLRGKYRNMEETAEIVGISSGEMPARLHKLLRNGGMTLKLSSAAVGETTLRNLGIKIANIPDREALATSVGTVVLQGLVGDYIEELSTFEPTAAEKKHFSGGKISFVIGQPKLFEKMEQLRKTLKVFEKSRSLKLSRERTYRKSKAKGGDTVGVRRVGFQDAPKDHQDVVHRLENTAFSFNSGHDILVQLFGTEDGRIDKDALVEHILGPETKATNFDAKERYIAQKNALMADLIHYEDAKEDVGRGNLYFNWFIAKNHRIHLDSNQINPQNDKSLARWLLTTKDSKKYLTKSVVDAAVNGTSADKASIMFAYGLVQAFDGNDGIPAVDKDNQPAILAAAKELLAMPSEELLEMVKKAAHVGHAALAVANIFKYHDTTSNTFMSDMVLEVDGVTNGFAFRTMQYPIETEGASVKVKQWLEKVGVIFPDSPLFSLKSMNGVDSTHEDVYTSVGAPFNDYVASSKAIKKARKYNAAQWVQLLKNYDDGLVDFSSMDKKVKKVVRNLMKSPVMIFNYAAGVEGIVRGLVEDQVMGTNYLSGRGLIDLLTKKVDGEYVITEDVLKETFKDKGEIYHKGRIALEEHSIDYKKDQNIIDLRTDLFGTIDALYGEPLKETLEHLFAGHTEVNAVITNAAQFMYEHFSMKYNEWRAENPDATEEQKLDYLRKHAAMFPGIKGASSKDQTDKVVFFKSRLESTGNYVRVGMTAIGGFGTNTVSRGFGEPGVGPAVLTILSMDSTVMARTLNGAHTAALPVHDAIVLGVDEFDTINGYNQAFYDTNKEYSIIAEFVKAIADSDMPDNMIAQVGSTSDKKSMKFKDMQAALVSMNTKVQAARDALYTKEVKIGQLVGPESTMVHIKGAGSGTSSENNTAPTEPLTTKKSEESADKPTKEHSTTEKTTNQETAEKKQEQTKSYKLPGGFTTNPGQTKAIDTIVSWFNSASNVFLLQGRGGTGKTTVINTALEHMGISPQDVLFATPTNKATKVIRHANKNTAYSDSQYKTVAQLLRLKPKYNNQGDMEFVKDIYADPIEIPKVLVIDEASMLRDEDLAALLELAGSKTKIIFMGDNAQLPPIGGASTIRSGVFDIDDSATLTQLQRQKEDSPIASFTSRVIDIVERAEKRLLNRENATHLKELFYTIVWNGDDYDYDPKTGEGVIVTRDEFGTLLPAFISDYLKNPATTKYINFNKFNHHATVAKLNKIREAIYGDRANTEAFIPGEPLMLNGSYEYNILNEQSSRADNGEEFTVVNSREVEKHITYQIGKNTYITELPLKVYEITAKSTINNEEIVFDKPVNDMDIKKVIAREKETLSNRGAKNTNGAYMVQNVLATALSHGYIINSHRAQGSTYDNVYMDLGNIAGQKLPDVNSILKSIYVSASRPRKKLVVIDNRPSQGSQVVNPKSVVQEEDTPLKVQEANKGEIVDALDKDGKCRG